MGVINDATENIESKKVALLFLDFIKAYDSVCRTFVLKALRKFGFSNECVSDIDEYIFKNNTVKIVFNGRLLQPIRVTNGVQRAVLCSLLDRIVGTRSLSSTTNSARLLANDKCR